MAKTRYLEYQIFLTDRAEVAARQAEFPNGIRVAPATAATTYAAPIQEFLDPFSAPSVRSPWFWAVVNDNFPRDQDSFTRKSGGWFGLGFLFGGTTTHIWIGKFVYSPGAGEIDGTPTEIVAMAQRQWCHGFEIPTDGDGASGGTATRSCSRDASRHADGMGWAHRGDTGSITQLTGSASRAHWDRFYLRIRKAPVSAGRIWLTDGVSNSGVELKLTSGLQIAVSKYVNGTATLLTSTSAPLTLNTWARIDLVMSYATGAAASGAFFQLWINGRRVINLVQGSFVVSGTGVGLGEQGAYASSTLGSLLDTDYEIDFDDWIGALEPLKETQPPFRYVGLDWLNGSKVQRISATSFGTGHDAVNWTNQSYSNLNQLPDSAATGMVSTTAAAAVVVNTDADRKIDALMNAKGIAAMTVFAHHQGVTSGAASLGFKIAGGTLDLLVLAASASRLTQQHFYRPSGLLTPVTPVAPLTLHYLKDNDSSQDTLYAMGAVAEVIGVFGREDVFPGLTAPATIAPRALGAHNNPYPESPWARNLLAPAPYIIHSGTYVGNATGQDLFFRLPVHWFYVRRVDTATHLPGLWFAPMLGPSVGLQAAIQPDRPVQAFIDPAFTGGGAEDDQEQRTIVRITGAQPNTNENAITYQYVAVCDPLARFLLTGGYGHGAIVEHRTDDLPNPDFTPESGFLQYLQPTGSTSFSGYFKGLGHAAQAASILNGVEIADFLEFGTGSIAPRSASALGVSRIASYALWRRDDGSGDPGLPKVVQLGTYVGDGSASRTISFGPTLVRPLWVMVVPHNAAAIVRDPSNLGTTSKPWSGVNNTTTGITAGGIDSFSVGTALNATGIVYSWIVLPGGTAACNNGFSCNGEFTPTEPETPDELCDDPEADNFGELGVCTFTGETPSTLCTDPLATNFGGLLPCTYGTAQPPGGECVDGETESTCITETTNLVNLALFEIGVTELLTNYCSQMSREAILARTVFNSTVRAVLHAYPWPFATKYATLALASQQPTHADWTFAYRLPSDCIFARRLVASRGTGVNPEPPAFMMSSEAGGGLLFSNQAGAVLEYTCRPLCVAVLGDALFLEALKWKLGAVLAPPLTRMDAPAARCQAEYEKCIEKANAIVKPGVPGVRTAADPASPDALAVCITANEKVVNRGLIRIGCQTIANLSTDQSRPAIAANMILEDEIRSTLRDYPWKFAKRYNEALVVVAGSTTVRANADWQYAYRLPSDYVMVRRLVADGTGRKFEEQPPPWEVGTDATGDLLFTDVVDPNLEYTARINCVVQKADELFRDALAWRMAAALAPSLAQVDPSHPEQTGRGPDAPPDSRQRISHKPNQAQMRAQATRYAQAMYLITLEKARVADANEAEPEDPPDAEWIRGR